MGKEDGLYLFKPKLPGLADIGKIESSVLSNFSFFLSFVENGMSSFNNPSVPTNSLIPDLTSGLVSTVCYMYGLSG